MTTGNTTDIDPRVIEIADQSIFKSQNTVLEPNGLTTTFDRDWIKNAFLISDELLSKTKSELKSEYDPSYYDKANRYWSSASSKFVDTRLGSNIGINPKPQYTRYADIREKGKLPGRKDVTLTNTNGNYGMGRYYSEAIDDPAQVVYLRFGVPEFNALTDFLLNAFDPDQTVMARTGRLPSKFYTAGKVVGTIFTARAFPILTGAIFLGRLIKSVFSRPTYKFYTIRPTMHNYWGSVNKLVNNMAINRGIFPMYMDDASEAQVIGGIYKIDNEYLNAIRNMMPDVFGESPLSKKTTSGNNTTIEGFAGIDMYAVANRAQRLANALIIEEYESVSQGDATKWTGYVRKTLTGNDTHDTLLSNKDGTPTLQSRLDRIVNFTELFGFKDDNKNYNTTESDFRIDPKTNQPYINFEKNGKVNPEKSKPGFFENFVKNLDADFREGGDFAVFRVDSTGSMSESFSNSTVESDISQKINSISAMAREARFTLSEGNLFGGGIGNLVTEVTNAVKDVGLGTLSGVTLGFSDLIAGISGSGFIDIPKHWQSASASLPRANYKMKLISPYGNAISKLINIDIPLCMLLAGALPLATGKSSYTSPYLCQVFDRGRLQIKTGIIESLQITRGTANLPFNTAGNCMAIDVNFSVVDLSSIVSMPVGQAGLFEFNPFIDEDNILMDYLAVLAGMDLGSQIYEFNKAKYNLARKLVGVNQAISPAYWASLFRESTTSGMMQYLTLGSFNVIEGMARDSSIFINNVANR